MLVLAGADPKVKDDTNSTVADFAYLTVSQSHPSY
jgi:hypothetical protein